MLTKRPAANVACLPYPISHAARKLRIDWVPRVRRCAHQTGLEPSVGFVGSFCIFCPHNRLDACLITFPRLVREASSQLKVFARRRAD